MENEQQETPDKNNMEESDPVVFLAKQVIEIRDELKSGMESMRKEMADSHKKDMDEIKKMIKDALND